MNVTINDDILTISDEQNNNKVFSILISFNNEDNTITYIAFTDYSKDEHNNIIVNSACYDTNTDNIKLNTIKDNHALDYIDKLLYTITETIKNEH